MDDDNSSVYVLCLSYSCMNDDLSHYSDTHLRFRMFTNACMHTRYYRNRRTLLSRLSSVLDELRSIGLPQQPQPPIRNGSTKVVHGSRRFLRVSVSHFVLADVLPPPTPHTQAPQPPPRRHMPARFSTPVPPPRGASRCFCRFHVQRRPCRSSHCVRAVDVYQTHNK